jgi:hypothetical protein
MNDEQLYNMKMYKDLSDDLQINRADFFQQSSTYLKGRHVQIIQKQKTVLQEKKFRIIKEAICVKQAIQARVKIHEISLIVANYSEKYEANQGFNYVQVLRFRFE